MLTTFSHNPFQPPHFSVSHGTCPNIWDFNEIKSKRTQNTLKNTRKNTNGRYPSSPAPVPHGWDGRPRGSGGDVGSLPWPSVPAPRQGSSPGPVVPCGHPAWVVFGVRIFPSLHSVPPGHTIRSVYTTILCPHQEPHDIPSPFAREETSGFCPAPLCAELS